MSCSFFFLFYLFSCTVLFLQPAVWLLTQHINKQNWITIIIIIIIIITVVFLLFIYLNNYVDYLKLLPTTRLIHRWVGG